MKLPLARRSRRTRLAALAVAGLAVVATSCSSTNPAALTVNGTDLSGKEFSDRLKLYTANDEYVASESAQGQTVEGPLEGSASVELANRLLTDEIFFILVREELQRRGVEVAPGNLELAAEMFAPRFLGGQAAFDAFPESFRTDYIRNVAEYISLQSSFAGVGDLKAEADAEAASNAEAYAKRCARHILVETEVEADDIVAELAAGGNFEQIAVDRSIDTGSGAQGGFLSCMSPAEASGTYVPEFAAAVNAAVIEEVTDPVQTQFGFHIILVERTEPSDITTIMQSLLQPGGAGYQEWLQQAFSSAEVEVNPRYGSWDDELMFVVPPDGSARSGAGATVTTPQG